MSPLIHELNDWPAFRWDDRALIALLGAARLRQGTLIGQMEALGAGLRDEAVLLTLTEDVVNSSALESEMLAADRVRSSLARRLGIPIDGLAAVDRRVDGVVEMVLDATRHYDRPVTAERLFAWHTALFPTGRSGTGNIRVGAWRDDRPARRPGVSGLDGRERAPLEAPHASLVPAEMTRFLEWFNDDGTTEAVLKAAQAHLWCMTIQPFDDGNGWIARTLADLALARSQESPRRFYSMSAQVLIERDDYDAILERTQQGPLDITPWLVWFLRCLTRAIDGARSTLAAVLAKARAWDALRAVSLNPRQRLMVTRLVDGVDGTLTTSKWAALARCSQDTALRDILQLVEQGVLVRNSGGGRSTSYALRAR